MTNDLERKIGNEIMECTRPDQKMMVETEKTHKGVNKWHTEAEQVEATRNDLPRLQNG